MMEKVENVMEAVKPDVFSMFGAVLGAILAWWTGLTPLAQALLVVQGADIITGIMCAVTGKSDKSASGKLSSGALAQGVAKKGLEWLVALVCYEVGAALGFDGISGAALTYMVATELVSLMENLNLFGLDVPLLQKLLDVAHGDRDDGTGDAGENG